MDKHVVILGAGPAGLSAAHELSKRGVGSTVFEAENVVGGLARTEIYKGYHFDIGGHRFYTKLGEVERMWHGIMGGDFIKVARLSRIYYRGKYFYYPLRPLNVLFGLGPINCALITLSYAYSLLFPTIHEESLEDFIVNRFGRRLYSIFFKTYTEKVWGIPCREIRAEWAAQRIRGLSFTSAVTNALFRSRGVAVKSLIEEFEYPRLGPGMLWNKVKQQVDQSGSSVRLNTPVVRVKRHESRIESVVVAHDGLEETVGGTHFISTLALRDLIRKLDPPAPEDVRRAANNLKYRDFLTIFLIINQQNLFPDNWIYIHTPHVHVGRIQNSKNWSQEMVVDPKMTSLSLEYFVTEGDELWSMNDSQLIELAKRELEYLKLARSDQVVDGVVKRMRKAYPVYDSTYRESLGIVRGFLDVFENFQTVGRNGMHRYNNQDHSIMTALLAARNVCGEDHDVWAVSTDMEYLEEIRVYRAKEGEVPVLGSA